MMLFLILFFLSMTVTSDIDKVSKQKLDQQAQRRHPVVELLNIDNFNFYSNRSHGHWSFILPMGLSGMVQVPEEGMEFIVLLFCQVLHKLNTIITQGNIGHIK